MTASFSSTATTLTIKFEYTGPTQTIYDIANDAANQLWLQGAGPHGEGTATVPGKTVTFASLTPEEKLAILDGYIANVFVELARQWYVQEAVNTAKTTAETSAKANLKIS